jgi:hypothetical protein
VIYIQLSHGLKGNSRTLQEPIMLELLAIPVCMIGGGVVLLFAVSLTSAGNQAIQAELDTRYPDLDDERR